MHWNPARRSMKVVSAEPRRPSTGKDQSFEAPLYWWNRHTIDRLEHSPQERIVEHMVMQSNPPSANVLCRTRMICNRGIGSGILIDKDEKQFFVTAKHMVQASDAPDDLCSPSHLDMHMRGRWFRFPVSRFGTAGTDLAVIEFEWIAEMHPIAIGSGGTVLGQDLIILGFPDGVHGEVDGDTLPIAGRATLSRLPTNTHDYFLIQCNAFHGFSGGPVVDMSSPNCPRLSGLSVGISQERHLWNTQADTRFLQVSCNVSILTRHWM